MAHRISYEDNTTAPILSRAEIADLIELFFRWENSSFRLKNERKHKSYRGMARHLSGGSYEICLYHESILAAFERKEQIGGNRPAPTLKMAAAQVLVHEIQHCNQKKFHPKDQDSSFYTGHHYWNLPAERDARGFVDNNIDQLRAYFALPPQTPRSDGGSGRVGNHTVELAGVIDLLSGCSVVSVGDINDELRLSRILNPSNFKSVREALLLKGVRIS